MTRIVEKAQLRKVVKNISLIVQQSKFFIQMVRRVWTQQVNYRLDKPAATLMA